MIRLKNQTVQSVQESVLKCMRKDSTSGSGRPFLLVDGLDMLLAATAATPFEVLDTVMEWREVGDYLQTLKAWI